MRSFTWAQLAHESCAGEQDRCTGLQECDGEWVEQGAVIYDASGASGNWRRYPLSGRPKSNRKYGEDLRAREEMY